MKRTLAATTLAVAAAVLAATTAGAASNAEAPKTYLIKATLDVKHEVPAPKDAKNAKGALTGKLTIDGAKSSFVWQLRSSGLSGPGSAYVHVGPAGKAGPISLPICVPCVNAAHGEYRGPYVATPTFLKAILNGGMYANVRTKLNPKGEIRGQLTATPA
jgi:hypothetical protein